MPDLRSILKDKTDDREVRWTAALALARLRDQTVVPDLLSILKDKTDDREVRKVVGLALIDFGQREAVVYLTRLITISYKNMRIGEANTLGELMQNYSAIC